MANLLNQSLKGIASSNRGGTGSGSSSGGRNSPYVRPGPDDKWKHDMYQGGPTAATVGGGGQRPSNKLIVTGLHYEVTQEELDVSAVGVIGCNGKRKEREGKAYLPSKQVSNPSDSNSIKHHSVYFTFLFTSLCSLKWVNWLRNPISR